MKSESVGTHFARLGRIVRLFLVIAVLGGAFCEWRDGSVTRLVSHLFKQGMRRPNSRHTEVPPAFLVDPPSHSQSVIPEDLTLARLRTGMLLAKEGRRIVWSLPPHLSGVPFSAKEPESGLPYEAVNQRDGIVLVLVPGGAFVMGAGPTAQDVRRTERPAHLVTLPPYYIGQTEVTRGQYDRFCRATGHRPIPKTMASYCVRADHPIVGVTLDDACAYCAWAGASLPTEAQWEKAARGTDGRHYPWGNEPPALHAGTHANFGRIRQSLQRDYEASYRPRPVGSFPEGASPYGALDMAGNVSEWCRDLFDPEYYRKSPAFHPTGGTRSTQRVVRGGCWSSSASSIRTFARAAQPREDVPVPRVGFRIVVNVAPAIQSGQIGTQGATGDSGSANTKEAGDVTH